MGYEKNKFSGYGSVLVIAIMIALFSVNLIHAEAGSKPYYTIEASSQPLSGTSIQLKWKKQSSNIKSVSEFRIYRCSSQKQDKTMKDYKVVCKVSGKTFTYTDKKLKSGKKYSYIIRAYKSVKGKLTLVGETTEEENITGVDQVSWNEYQRSDTVFSPKQIELSFFSQKGMNPTGYQIFRKLPGEKYKKIKTLKTSKRQAVYIDKSVVAGQKYYYKVRAYKKYGRKTIYGKSSETLRMSAVNYSGKYTCSIVEENLTSGTVSVKLNSDRYNGVLTFETDRFGQDYSDEYKDDKSLGTYEEQMVAFPNTILDAWSFDGENWATGKQKVTLSGGKSIYLRFRSKNDVKLTGKSFENKSIYCEDAYYNYLPAILSLDGGTTGTARYNMEYIH